jgi:hypothetical protein
MAGTGGYRENAGGWNARGFFGSIKLDVVTGCWNWITKSRHEFGYGKIGYLGRRFDAHRVAAFLWLKLPIDSPAVVRHKCDNPSCCNPKHLEIGTQHDNILDMISRHGHYKSLRTTCPKGHKFDSENTYWSPDRKYRRCRTCDAASHKRREN